MAQRQTGIDLAGLVQQVPTLNAAKFCHSAETGESKDETAKSQMADFAGSSIDSAENRNGSLQPTTRSLRVVADDGESEVCESSSSVVDSWLGRGIPCASFDVLTDTSSRFRDLDHQLGQVVAAWPKLSPSIRTAVTALIRKALDCPNNLC